MLGKTINWFGTLLFERQIDMLNYIKWEIGIQIQFWICKIKNVLREPDGGGGKKKNNSVGDKWSFGWNVEKQCGVKFEPEERRSENNRILFVFNFFLKWFWEAYVQM